jgi:hypothetical protein
MDRKQEYSEKEKKYKADVATLQSKHEQEITELLQKVRVHLTAEENKLSSASSSSSSLLAATAPSTQTQDNVSILLALSKQREEHEKEKQTLAREFDAQLTKLRTQYENELKVHAQNVQQAQAQASSSSLYFASPEVQKIEEQLRKKYESEREQYIQQTMAESKEYQKQIQRCLAQIVSLQGSRVFR